MTNRAAARRYARALLDVSQQDADPDRVATELSTFVTLMRDHTQLRETLTSPAVPSSSKQAVVDALVARLGDLAAPTTRLLALLADRDRLVLLDEIAEIFNDCLLEMRGVQRARITTAATLPDERVQAIAQQLETATGGQVQIEAGVDTSLIGGAVTQIGSTVFDGSVARHLARLRQRFLSEA